MEALAILVGAGRAHVCLPAKDQKKRRDSTRAFNAAVCARAQGSGDFSYLASPVTGGGVPVDRFSQLFLAARQARHEDPAGLVWSYLERENQAMVKDGTPLAGEAAHREELTARLNEFEDKKLPVLQQLGIA